MKTSIYMLVFVALFFTACTGGSNETNHSDIKEMNHPMDEHNHGNHGDHDHGDHDHGSKSTEKRNISATNNKNSATNGIIEGYIAIKNGLVEDDQLAAAKGAKMLLSAMSKFDMSTVSKDVHMEFMDIFNNAKENAEHISKNPIDHQREHFEDLSTDINDMIALVGTAKKLYQDFCPMANDGKGAIWISEIENIRNPFFGSKMMKCGKIQKEFN